MNPLDCEQTCLFNKFMTRSPLKNSQSRQQLVETADRLFYRHGIRAVGVDRVIAEAGVAKATLYAHFPSKDDLILAVLHHREESMMEFFRSAMERHEKRTKDRLRAFFAALKDWFNSPDFRGCAFINAAVELADAAHPGSHFVQEHKRRFRDFLGTLVEETIGNAHIKVASAISLLVEGAIVTAVIQGSPESADVARDAALAVTSSSVKR
jgi:AcrR family transcriptional regulator